MNKKLNLLLKEKGPILISSLTINSIDDTVQIFSEIKNSDREKLLCASLDKNNKILGCEVVSIGSLNATLVHPREVLKVPIKLGADKIVVAHNHPSGNSEPSKEDLEITQRLKKACDVVKIELLGHVIIGFDKYTCVSFDRNNKTEINTNKISDYFVKEHPVNQYEIEQKRLFVEDAIMIKEPSDVLKIAEPLLNKNKSSVIALFLDTRNTVVSSQYLGSTQRSITSEKLAKFSITNNSLSVLLCSNFELSNDIVKNVQKDLDIVGVELLDAISISENSYISKKEQNVLKKESSYYNDY